MKVRYFARAREIAGTGIEEIDPTGLTTVADVLERLTERHGPEFAALVERSTIMSDDEVVQKDELASTPLGAELAVLPPVSGGDGPHDVDGHGDEPHEVDGPHDDRRGSGDHGGHGDHGGAAPDRILKAAVLTVSDRAYGGVYDDRTGPAVVQLLRDRLGAHTVEERIVADDRDMIAAAVTAWCDHGGPNGQRIDLVITNGGTGLSDRDVTPEALRTVLDVEAPGLGELMRATGLVSTPMAALSRQLAGRRARTVIVAVPGSVGAATESLDAVVAVLPHLCELAAQQNPSTDPDDPSALSPKISRPEVSG